jgi:probable F420-dependent oxidoreductase
MVTLSALAMATSTIRLGTMVLNNDFHHPGHLARDAGFVDLISEGRLELGLGAGHSHNEYEAIGMPFAPASVRIERLAEAIPLIRRLLDGEVVTHRGPHYTLNEMSAFPRPAHRVPILVGGNGPLLLTLAATHADIVNVSGLGRTREDGSHHDVLWDHFNVEARFELIRAAAATANRTRPLELSIHAQAVIITDNRRAAAQLIADNNESLDLASALEAPFLLLGTPAQIRQQIIEMYERWGVSYITTFEPHAEALARVIH